MLIFTRMKAVKCPQCGTEAVFEGNEFRPFCSERCKLLDFGAWADERYALPAEPSELSPDEIDAFENSPEKNEV